MTFACVLVLLFFSFFCRSHTICRIQLFFITFLMTMVPKTCSTNSVSVHVVLSHSFLFFFRHLYIVSRFIFIFNITYICITCAVSIFLLFHCIFWLILFCTNVFHKLNYFRGTYNLHALNRLMC